MINTFPESILSEKYRDILKIKEEINDIVVKYIFDNISELPFIIGQLLLPEGRSLHYP